MSGDTAWGVTRHVDVGDGARLLVRSSEAEADKPALLVLARHGGNSREFWSIAADLADRWCVVGVDLRGSGGSDHVPPDQGYSQQQWARDVATVLERSSIEPAAALGVSVGGLLIVDLHELGVIRPERAVVVDIAPSWPDPPDPHVVAERMATNLRLLSAAYPDVESIRAAWRTVQGEAWPDADGALIERSVDACAVEAADGWRFDCDVEGYMMRPPGEAPVLDRWDAWRSFADETDTLVVRGAGSEVLVPGAFEEMTSSARTRGIVVPDVGHWPPLEREPTRSAITDWLG